MTTHVSEVPFLRFADAHLATGVRLRYAEQGDPAGPALVLLHGYSDSWYSWSGVLPLLPPHYHVFALDQRGHGDSDRPAAGYHLDDFAADVRAFMDAVGLATATIVGHSLSSWVAQRAAAAAPARVERLVLLGSSARTDFDAVRELDAVVQALPDPIPEEFIRAFQASTLHLPVADTFFERVVAESRKLPAHVWRSASAGWLTESRVADHTRIRMPTLIGWGDRDAVFLREEQDALVAALPGAEFIVYPETGHALHWERPGRLARDLDRFLRATARASAA
ncbi:MAG: alpha/beta hydrolase [Dehalococcoidia bacterium]